MVLVIGATGDLGSQVVRYLRQAGAEVRCLIRKGSAYFWLNDTGATYFFGDLRQADTLRRACKGARHVVSCAGLRTEGRESMHRAVTAHGHAELWRAARAAGVQRAVYVSCLGVGSALPSPAHEARAEAEAALRSAGLEHVILRPSLFAATFAQAARFGLERGWVPMLGAGDNPVSPIGVDDLALAVVACLDLPGARDRVIEVGGPDRLSYREALERALASLGATKATTRSFSGLLRSGGLPLLGAVQPRWANRLRELALHASEDLSVPAGSFESTFGWTPAPYEGALRRALVRPSKPTAIGDIYPLMQHRGPKATAYVPGTRPVDDLPEGPPTA